MGVQSLVVPVAVALGQETGKWRQARGREGVSAAGNRQAPAQPWASPDRLVGGLSQGRGQSKERWWLGEGWALPLWGHS